MLTIRDAAISITWSNVLAVHFVPSYSNRNDLFNFARQLSHPAISACRADAGLAKIANAGSVGLK